ncbi:MAG: hypothetical protein ACYTHN_22385, partial [Planctomycetota bacterium]
MTDRLKAPWTAEDFFGLCWVDEAAISPDGKRVAYTVREVDRENNRYRSAIWVVNTQGGRQKRMTFGAGTGDSQPTWSPKGRQIAFTSARTGTPQIYLLDLSGGEARPLTALERGAHSPTYAPDGRHIAFLSRVNEKEAEDAVRKKKVDAKAKARIDAERKEAEEKAKDPRVIRRLLYRTGQEWLDGRWNQIFLVDGKGKRPPRRLTSGEAHHTRPKFHPDGSAIFTTSERTGIEGHEEVYDILRVPLEGGGFSFVTEKLCVTSYDVSPDGRRIVYTSVPGVKYYKHPLLAKVKDLETGTEVEVSGGVDTDVHAVAFGEGGREVLFLSPLRGEIGVQAVPVEGGEIRTVVEEKGRKILVFDVSRTTGAIAYVATAPEIPADLFVVP